MKIRKTEELKTLAMLAGRTPEEVAEILTHEIEAYGLQGTGRDDRVGTLRWTLDKFWAMLKKIVPEAAEGRAAGALYNVRYEIDDEHKYLIALEESRRREDIAAKTILEKRQEIEYLRNAFYDVTRWRDIQEQIPDITHGRLSIRCCDSRGNIYQTGGWYDVDSETWNCDLGSEYTVIGWRPIIETHK